MQLVAPAVCLLFCILSDQPLAAGMETRLLLKGRTTTVAGNLEYLSNSNITSGANACPTLRQSSDWWADNLRIVSLPWPVQRLTVRCPVQGVAINMVVPQLLMPQSEF